jgi:hypothetical protein
LEIEEGVAEARVDLGEFVPEIGGGLHGGGRGLGIAFEFGERHWAGGAGGGSGVQSPRFAGRENCREKQKKHSIRLIGAGGCFAQPLPGKSGYETVFLGFLRKLYVCPLL